MKNLELRNQFWAELITQLSCQVRDQVGNQFYEQLRDQLVHLPMNQISTQLDEQLSNELYDHIEEIKCKI